MNLQSAKKLVKNSGWRRGKITDGMPPNRIFKFSEAKPYNHKAELFKKEYPQNGKEISVHYVSAKYCRAHRIPKCDCLFLHFDHAKRFNGSLSGVFLRPDEALQVSQMLVNAVHDVVSDYKIRL